jgi:hypothetical protein
MSSARHHAEWLSLVETSGPFLSMPVLLSAFPQGLDAHDPEHARDLRLALDEWEESQEGPRPDRAIHTAWIRFVLTRTLELPDDALAAGQAIPPALRVTVPEHGESLVPDLLVRNPDGGPEPGKPRLLVQTYPPGQDLGRAVAGQRWKASPETRMVELLRGLGLRLGLVTNGEHWMLVWAPANEAAGFGSWYASLWLEEPLTLRAFRSLLGAHRFFGVPESATLEALLAESASAQQEVTDQLGYQVRRAVEVLVHSLDRADKDRGRTLLRDVPETRLYEAAVTVMMRLVFLFAAEERGLLLLGDPLFDQHYAVSTLRARLRETADQHGEEILEHRIDAWCRLLATFRAVHAGIRHDRLTLPAYGGTLFDPDRFPFLEGRAAGTSWRNTPASPLPVTNRTVLHLLEALQLLQVRVPGGGPAEARRLSFRALDIEQIGHVYEGLLDHTAVRATGPVIGLVGTREKEPEVTLSELEGLRARDEARLREFLEEETGRSGPAIKRALTYQPVGEDLNRFLIACDNNDALERRVRPFAGLVREDTFGYPVVISPGSVYVTQGSDRRTTGTHYTPRSLTEPIVQHTLDPLVYVGPAEGKPRSEWRLRPPADLLALKICDMAMGSGAFLVQTCRYLSERLVEAWEDAEKRHPGAPGVTPEGAASSGAADERLIPKDTEERLALARRLVADRCLYGVDKNPMAVEMAKLSLWLVTLQKDRPFTFLDHALRCGDSLLGLTSPEQISSYHLDPQSGSQLPLWASICAPALKAAMDRRRQLESFTVEGIRDAEAKARLLAEADAALQTVKLIADAIVAAAISTAGQRGHRLDDRLEELSERLTAALTATSDANRTERLAALRKEIADMLRGGTSAERVPFHWLLEFPEVFPADVPGKRGFDAIVGNPPFRGGKLISGIYGKDYREFLVQHLATGTKGHADLCAYFFLRAGQILRDGGGFGLLATNTIAQGDTREVGLDQLTADGLVIPRAVPSRKWPGTANLEVAHVWVRRGPWAGEHVLDDRPAPGITAFLTPPGAVTGKPYPLVANAKKSFIGSYVLGMGFVLTPDEAQTLIDKDPRNRDVLFPYLNGEDLNSRPDQSASRWVINFRDWPLRRGATGRWSEASDRERAAWLREGVVPNDYSHPVAADYPDCLGIVAEKVRPERQRRKPNGEFVLRRPLPQRWWRYADRRPELYATIAGLRRLLVTAEVSKHASVAFAPATLVFSHMLIVFSLAEFSELALLQSSIHEIWARAHGSTLETRFRYTPSDCFDTFPFPTSLPTLEPAGRRYDSERNSVMLATSTGLTKIYNRFHDPGVAASDIQTLRELHVELDNAVVAAYSWTDLDLSHGFHETRQGLRFGISDSARQEILARLLALNHERYTDEVRRGLHRHGRQPLRTLVADGSPPLFPKDFDGQ